MPNSPTPEKQPCPVDFSHRLWSGPEITPLVLSETITDMTGEAIGVLSQMSIQYSNEVPLNDELNHFTIEAVIKTIKDINKVVEAYYQSATEMRAKQ